jgi:hypothetical protein
MKGIIGMAAVLGILGLAFTLSVSTTETLEAQAVTPVQIFGVWHAGNDYCHWSYARDTAEFEAANHWIFDRGDGTPSINVICLSFVNPLELLNKLNDATTVDGIPAGMNLEIINFIKSRGIRVMLSIGGITYTDDWETALDTDAHQLGLNAAEAAANLGVGVEIDFEGNQNPHLPELQAFIDAYRSVHPYDATGQNHAARLTIDLAAGDRWLIDICTKATTDWLRTDAPVLDYANAMVTARRPNRVSTVTGHWQEHVDGKPQYDPPIPPLAPCKFTGGLWLTGRKVIPECDDFYNSYTYLTSDYVQTVMPNGAGTTPGMLGYMFWAAGCDGTRTLCTNPPNTCENGMGVAAQYLNVPVPMPPLRQQ